MKEERKPFDLELAKLGHPLCVKGYASCIVVKESVFWGDEIRVLTEYGEILAFSNNGICLNDDVKESIYLSLFEISWEKPFVQGQVVEVSIDSTTWDKRIYLYTNGDKYYCVSDGCKGGYEANETYYEVTGWEHVRHIPEPEIKITIDGCDIDVTKLPKELINQLTEAIG